MRLISYKIGCQGETQGQLNWGLPTTKPYCDAMHHPYDIIFSTKK
jgi:hypothetical protein